jgi:hypothetical protein
MMAGFETKLRAFVERGDEEGDAQLTLATERLGDFLAGMLQGNAFAPFHDRDMQLLDGVIEEARDAAKVLDATDIIRKNILHGRGQIVDVPMHHDLREAQARIQAAFEDGRLPERGFVYVAWRARPERFIYIGKAASVRRLHLPAHGKLAHATASASTLSLLFPPRSEPRVIDIIETSAMALVDRYSVRGLELNDTLGRLRGGAGQVRLNRIVNFLKCVLLRIQNT